MRSLQDNENGIICIKIILPKFRILVPNKLKNRKTEALESLTNSQMFCNCEKEIRITEPESELACLHTRASVACSSVSNRTRACFFPFISKTLLLIMVPCSSKRLTISSSVMSCGRVDKWIILVGEQQ